MRERVGELARLADTAHQNPTQASAVLNQAALLASDVGLPELARTWCHAHAHARFAALPGTGKEAIAALEPVVNLARLRIREGDGNGALHLLETVFSGVQYRADTEVDQDLTVPCSRLTATDEDYEQVLRWTWVVLLADGTRAMTTAGRWNDALGHLSAHRGNGARMSDGRQVAVIAHLISGRPGQARALIEATVPGEPWEQAVTALLNAMSHGTAPGSILDTMVDRYAALVWKPETAVFHTRLGLSITEILGDEARSHALVTDLVERTLQDRNGYCARELVDSTRVTEQGELEKLVTCCGLGGSVLPHDVQKLLGKAIRTSMDALLRANLHPQAPLRRMPEIKG
ncbi:hypothetical protein MRI28_17080 [Nocardiopsis dassonvillei]|uniref:hypothetical protein n=1 Tax=Nocardiopsis dassonvillei TaxID=2014 RepID=UPI00200E07E2|nr:hypothetical protein [Nocardiopsis dassonvillei]MCK9871329.1 hypothetical protein [Nocardiopsis dassonvillei]